MLCNYCINCLNNMDGGLHINFVYVCVDTKLLEHHGPFCLIYISKPAERENPSAASDRQSDFRGLSSMIFIGCGYNYEFVSSLHRVYFEPFLLILQSDHYSLILCIIIMYMYVGDEISSESSSPSSLPSTSATITSNAASALPPVDITEVTVEDGEETSGGAIRGYKVRPLTWYSHHCLPQGLQGSTLRVHEFGDRLYVCSGATNDGLPNKAIFHCSVRNLTRWVRADPDVPQYYSASAIIQGEVVLISGLGAVDGKCTGLLSSYDSKAHVWVQRLPPLPTPRSSASAFVYGDYLVVVGG